MKKRAELTGQRFGAWTVLGPAPMRKTRVMWLCRCDCGTERDISTGNLSGNLTTSCGCKTRTAGGWSGTRTYRSWRAMHQRCRDASNDNYGRRGITVCERWHVFENFLADMGERPEGMSLDRWPNGDGNYEPGNTRWATPKQQGETRRKPVSLGSRFH